MLTNDEILSSVEEHGNAQPAIYAEIEDAIVFNLVERHRQAVVDSEIALSALARAGLDQNGQPIEVVEEKPDIPILEEAFISMNKVLYPENNRVSGWAYNLLRLGYSRFHQASERLKDRSMNGFQRIGTESFRRRYRHFEGVYLEPGVLSFNRLKELRDGGQIPEMYGIGEKSTAVILAVLESVEPQADQ